MIVFPNCKINLGLQIVRKRADGYHDLETVFYPLPFFDVLEIIESRTDNKSIFTSTGITIPGDTNQNLAVKAAALLRSAGYPVPPVRIHLHKAIPIGAGLGGGSADGAFALQLLNEKFELGITRDQLMKYALELGSDCPFFLYNKPCIAYGRGEKLEPVDLDLSAYSIVIIHPGIVIPTSGAFSKIIPATPALSLKEVISQPAGTWRMTMKNDFEVSVFQQYPEIKQLKDLLYEAGAVYASMSGSGSTMYALFNEADPQVRSLPPHYFQKVIARKK